MALIQVREVCKEFRVLTRKQGAFAALRSLVAPEYTVKRAVDRVSFSIERGETVAYIGPNGAGKSTTIKMLTGILAPTSGEILVDGRLPHRQRKEHARRIGVVFGQKTQLWWDVPVIESLRLLKEIYKIPDATYRANLERFRELLDLHEFEKTPVRQLSLGQRMRSDLAASLLHNPDILFLDEPTIGVDVVAKERFRTFIQHLSCDERVTVLLTTHDMSDIEKVCERAIIIDHGKVIYNGSVNGLKERTPHRTLVVDFAEDVTQLEVGDAEIVQAAPQRVSLRFDRRRISASQLITELAARYPVRDVSVIEPEIESIVREIYAGETPVGAVGKGTLAGDALNTG